MLDFLPAHWLPILKIGGVAATYQRRAAVDYIASSRRLVIRNAVERRAERQGFQACHRGEYAHGVALEQPGCIAIGGEVARRIHLRTGRRRFPLRVKLDTRLGGFRGKGRTSSG
jgi:hypothetical protein